jgi:outer membrane protein OmpA-like peptidoglycan-associated protein
MLLATFPVNDDDLAALAARRAQAVQAYLLQNGKVEASRIFVTAAGTEKLRRDGSRAYLQFR